MVEHALKSVPSESLFEFWILQTESGDPRFNCCVVLKKNVKNTLVLDILWGFLILSQKLKMFQVQSKQMSAGHKLQALGLR